MLKTLTPDQTTDEKELFRLIQKGNREAFTVIYEKYNKMLYALAFQYLKDSSKAQDIVQHAFIKLWELQSDIRVTVNLRNYLYTMTKNSILNYIRNETNALEHNYRIVQENEEYEDDLLEKIERKELMSIFREAIDSLPEQKRIICLHKINGKLSNQEIADKMGLSLFTVKTHYAQSIKMLRAYMLKKC